MSRPITTLFMLMSVDGKISTGTIIVRENLRRLPGMPEYRRDRRRLLTTD